MRIRPVTVQITTSRVLTARLAAVLGWPQTSIGSVCDLPGGECQGNGQLKLRYRDSNIMFGVEPPFDTSGRGVTCGCDLNSIPFTLFNLSDLDHFRMVGRVQGGSDTMSGSTMDSWMVTGPEQTGGDGVTPPVALDRAASSASSASSTSSTSSASTVRVRTPSPRTPSPNLIEYTGHSPVQDPSTPKVKGVFDLVYPELPVQEAVRVENGGHGPFTLNLIPKRTIIPKRNNNGIQQ